MRNKLSRYLAIAALVLAVAGLSLQLTECKSTNKDDVFTILSFSDFHGQYAPGANASGAAYLVSTIEQLYKENKNGTLVLNGGDNFSGGYFSLIAKSKYPSLQNDFYASCKTKYSSLGNHEFDWGIDSLISYATKGNITYLSANIFSDSNHVKRPTWLKPYAIETTTLNSGKSIKVAIIGLSTVTTANQTVGKATKGYYFANPYTSTKTVMESLKDSADIYVVLAHIGMSMKEGKPVFDKEEQADSLPYIAGLNAIIAAHSHNAVCGHINGVAVVQSECYGNYVGRIRMKISDNKVDSSWVDVLPTAGATPDSKMQEKVNSVIAKYNLSEVIAEANDTISYNRSDKSIQFTEMGAMVTTAYRDKFMEFVPDAKELVLGVCNAGGIRSSIEKGNITKLNAGDVLPFGGELLAYKITGKDLKKYFEYGIFGTRGRYGTLQAHDLEIKAKNGKVLSIVYVPNGKDISDNEEVIVVTESFLVDGGDGYRKLSEYQAIEQFNGSVSKEERNPTSAFCDYLRAKKIIDTNTAKKCVLHQQ
jgi:2',3'-cyclic-nucleotide 2'-phosphodiesterase (5'-nucleotidase family)